MDRPIVTVNQGKLQGILEENLLGSHHYFSFKGIPFAAPPVGELRFKDPEPPTPWEGIRDASKNSDICAQLEHSKTQVVVGSEDCLYLNICVPYNVYRTTGNPVMVWIHGGGYVLGSGNDTHKRFDYLVKKDVILVSVNYRLGALGFLNLDHEVASGNQGLKDQVAALKWIKENIKAFGGDPNNITVFGVSAGSTCINLLMLSPLSKGLFHKAILQSGIITSDWAMIRNQPEANSFKLASILGNDSKDPEKVIEFLRTIPTVKIIKAQHKVLTPEEARTLNVPFGPTIDDRAKKPFLPYPISQLLDDDNNIPIMIGYTSHEYISLLQDTSEKTLKTMYADLPRYVGNFINSQDPEKIMQMTEKIKQKYFCNKLPFTEESIPSIIRWLSDLHFNIPIEDFVDKRRKKKHVPTYFYRFSYVGNEKIEKNLINNNKLTAIGAAHTDDMSYLFYIPKYKINNPQPPAIDTKDRKMLEILTRMWTNFAKTGNPTPVLDQYVTTNWLPATADIFNYLDIGDTLQLLTITDYNSILQELEL
ncbi:esterase FE4-like isoform X1 [Temnothorax curvispinosus]|uniref:Carboxylic ester hydrolase n=1 Tax=Temnothorax curvispinosus TaxID=300111 RepID=A0A6J1PGR7_9HYME|nr:esterase FE4-like isoform X1 [Temnothorax curvispinosus]